MSSNPADRRQALRVPLDTPCLLTMMTDDGQGYATLLTDISTGGVQLAVTPGKSLKMLANAQIALRELPEGLRILEGCRGKIVWTTDRYCGVRLDAPLAATIDELALLTCSHGVSKEM